MDLLSQMLRRLMQKDPHLSVVAWLFPLESWWSLAFRPWLSVYPRAGRELKSGIVPLSIFGLVPLTVTMMARVLRFLKVPSACAYGNHSSPYYPTSKGHLSTVQWGGMVEISWVPAFSPGHGMGLHAAGHAACVTEEGWSGLGKQYLQSLLCYSTHTLQSKALSGLHSQSLLLTDWV